MIGGINRYGSEIAKECTELESRAPTVIEGLERKKALLDKQLEKVNRALELAKANPSLIEFVNALQDVNY